MSAEETSVEIMSDGENVGGDNVGGQNVGEKTSVDEMSGDQIFKINVFFHFFFKNLQFFGEILKFLLSNVGWPDIKINVFWYNTI